MKIKFHCNNCLEDFQVTDKYLVTKSSVICSNCESELPNESFELLKQGVSLIMESRSKMKPEDTTAGWTRKFNFTIVD